MSIIAASWRTGAPDARRSGTEAASTMRIDLSADVGEALAAAGDVDEGLIPLVSSVNVACGAHAGDPTTIARTVALARAAGAAVGAHPSYPDRDGFGRRAMAIGPDELEASVAEQIATVAAAARAAGVLLRHIKPHGALYNAAAVDPVLADVVARAVVRADPSLALVGLAGSALLDAGRAAGLRVRAEAFPDRAYEPDGSLRSRALPGALVVDSAVVAARAVAMAVDGVVEAVDGTLVPLVADTLCLHGDTPGAVDHARSVRTALAAAGFEVVAP
jgi:UPF0271 protein